MQAKSMKAPAGPFDPADGTSSGVMSEHAFALWGIDDVAYIKQVFAEGQLVWAICSADGASLGIVPDRDLAFAAATQNDRVPVSVH